MSFTPAQTRERRIIERKRSGVALDLKPFSEEIASAVNLRRWASGYPLLDQALGGGFLQGSMALMGGAPGVGKSTLVAQVAGRLIADGARVLMVSGEEETGQIAERLVRLGLPRSENLLLGSSLTLEEILWKTEETAPDCLIVDSVQTVNAEEGPYPAGSPAMIRLVTGRLLFLAKKKNITVILLGHVTKEGTLAGPKHLEHMVDVVLSLEKPRAEEIRFLRVLKNRFGPTNALAVFEMSGGGFKEVADPSASFISADWRARLAAENKRTGLASSFALDGGQAFLIQAEALIGKKKLAPGKRAALGIDGNRLQILIAVLERSLNVTLEFCDVFLSLVGGVRVRDPGIDLALLMALGSLVLDFGLPTDAAFLGEVSLSGDVLAPKDLALRIKQAQALGFTKIIHARPGFYRARDFLSSFKQGGSVS